MDRQKDIITMETEKFVKCVMRDKNVAAKEMLERILKRKTAARIKETLQA